MMLALLREAIATEIRNRADDLRARFAPAPVVAPVEAPPSPPPAEPEKDRRWESSAFHLERLAATACLCGAPKNKHSYHCLGCRPKGPR